jgi:hypothetical protein
MGGKEHAPRQGSPRHDGVRRSSNVSESRDIPEAGEA